VSANAFENSELLGQSQPIKIKPYANIYVDDDNTQGPWDGTLENPYRTIIDGVDNASEGDTIFVFNGVYSKEYVYVRKSINIIGEDKYNTILSGPSSAIELSKVVNGFELSNFMFININAIYLYHSSYCVINNNIIKNSPRGIWLSNCSDCTVSNNEIRARWDSIILSHSKNCIINGNYIYGFNESLSGIDIRSSANDSIISDNTISNCEDGIDIHRSHRATITDNNIINCTRFGIILVASSNSTILRNKITKNYQGIELSNSDDVVISDNIVTDNTNLGISLSYGKNIHVSYNFIDNNPYGLDFCYVDDSVFENNTITNSSQIGIDAMDSGLIDSNNLVLNNNVNNCYIGIMLEHSWGNTCKKNTVNNNEFGITVYGDALFNVITKNEVKENDVGVVLYGYRQGKSYIPLGNYVVANNISDNTNCGVYATVLTRLNYIYYNNFVDNFQNAYDNGTNIWYKYKPLGKSKGNYWDDYNGVDENPNDGIGDTPYNIPPSPFRNTDRYPCMEPIDIENTVSSYNELIQVSPQSQPSSQPGSTTQQSISITTTSTSIPTTTTTAVTSIAPISKSTIR